MSREILFRGKRVDTGEWAYGRLIAVSSMALGEVIEAIQEMSIDGKMCSSKIVNPATIGQYTGLKDVDGVKVFEGDYVGVDKHKRKWVVEWGYFGDAGFYAHNQINSGRTLDKSIYGMWAVVEITEEEVLECKVSGNIHDN